VFRGASQSLLNLLPPMPPDVATERSRGWLQRKLSGCWTTSDKRRYRTVELPQISEVR
jgi:hypothetical protein